MGCVIDVFIVVQLGMILYARVFYSVYSMNNMYMMMCVGQVGAVTHLKITIYPDGGVMRLRALGFPSPDANSRL